MSNGIGGIIHGVIGVGALIVVGARSCDDIFRTARHIDDVPTSAITRTYDDIYRGVDESVSSLDDIAESKGLTLSQNVTVEDKFLRVLVKHPRSYEVEKTLPGEHIHYSNIDNVKYSKIDSSWFESVDNPKIVSLFPTTPSQYKKVYGRLPSITAETKLKRFNNVINADPALVRNELEKTDLILKSIEDADGSPIVILAHSEDGGQRIVFPDGTSMNVKDIHAHCIQALKRCMVLTCHGDDFGLTENISANEALSMWRSVSELASSSEKISVSDLVYQARKIRNQHKTKKTIITWSAATIIGTPYMKTSFDTESKSDKVSDDEKPNINMKTKT